MNLRHVTIGLLVAVAILLSAYDVFAVWRGGVGSTISEVIRDAAHAHPIIAAAFGALVGHFFW